MNSLRELRKEKGLSQQSLAELLEVNQTAVSQWERGITTPSSRMLLKLSHVFKVNPCELLNNEAATPYQWDDPEIMAAVRESLPKQVSGLTDILNGCSDQEQKLTFDILVELAHVLKLGSPEQRAAAITLLQSVFAASTRYIDVCVNAAQDIEPAARIEKAREAALSQYGQALDEALLFLPH